MSEIEALKQRIAEETARRCVAIARKQILTEEFPYDGEPQTADEIVAALIQEFGLSDTEQPK